MSTITSIMETVAPSAAFKPSDEFAGTLLDELHAIVETDHAIHPFNKENVREDNAIPVMGEYFAMSQAFPYLQAGVGKDFIFRAMESNTDIPKDVERTFVVGMFLTWDETGGNYLLLNEGIKSLPKILSTGRFHANMLRGDIRRIFGTDPKPVYTPLTTKYLKALYDRLASEDAITRAAIMVAFEIHAGQMIESLWEALVANFSITKENLSYFQAHVGGDDPLEAYHIAMTKKLISTIVTPENKERFLAEFRESYKLNFDWCRDITL